eukprot:TRINITY_DN8326_c0_g1_i1.p1 TRINITY_DN8326_c0_g1~~TRINITY_DN8326_c0_g1_i1.p1  ORF type:complete len:293 (+),score=95.04 TRINITY_DN8326_c0_g1_i1:279-1157(+)
MPFSDEFEITDERQAEINEFIEGVKQDHSVPENYEFDVNAIEAFVGSVLGGGNDGLFSIPEKMPDSDEDDVPDETGSYGSATTSPSERSNQSPSHSRSRRGSSPRNTTMSSFPPLPPLPFGDSGNLPYGVGGGGGTTGTSSENGSPAYDSRLTGKVKVFISMHGCPLLKSMLMSCDMDYDQFMHKVEQKLNEPDLRVYYDEDGDKVEIDDNEAVEMFFSRRHEGPEIKLKLIAFPAEIVNSRAARAFQSESGALTSRSFGPMSARGEGRARGSWQRTMGSLDSYRATPRARF